MNHIGEIESSLIAFGGVYSNLEALQALKYEMGNRGIPPSNIVCTGDIMAYCADPESCVQLIKDWGIYIILGNVEEQINIEADVCGCNFEQGTTCDRLSKTWYSYINDQLSDGSKQWLKSIPNHITFTMGGKKGMVIHGGFQDIAQFIFKSTNSKIKEDILKDAKADIILAGHCGLPFKEQLSNGQWYNTGVLGMPANDGTQSTWYLELFNNAELKSVYHRLDYDHLTTFDKMRVANLPNEYAETLVSGIWDNCDVLPEYETSQQGLTLNLNR